MTRGATNALLPDPIDRQGHRSKHPQPVLANLLPSGVEEGALNAQDQARQPPNSSKSPASNGHVDPESDESDDDGLHMPRTNGRRRSPAPMRARSDLVYAEQRRRNGTAAAAAKGEEELSLIHI